MVDIYLIDRRLHVFSSFLLTNTDDDDDGGGGRPRTRNKSLYKCTYIHIYLKIHMYIYIYMHMYIGMYACIIVSDLGDLDLFKTNKKNVYI